MTGYLDPITQIVVDAGGELIGRTRLQKISYLLHATGFEEHYKFAYKHYGPFSDELTDAAQIAEIFGDISEEERHAAWGGTYFVFKTSHSQKSDNLDRLQLIKTAADADPVHLELAATALYFALSGYPSAWDETKRRKPGKATPERLKQARSLYQALGKIPVPRPLPST